MNQIKAMSKMDTARTKQTQIIFLLKIESHTNNKQKNVCNFIRRLVTSNWLSEKWDIEMQ